MMTKCRWSQLAGRGPTSGLASGADMLTPQPGAHCSRELPSVKNSLGNEGQRPALQVGRLS